MSLSSDLQAFASAVHAALAEGAHMLGADAWLASVEAHFTAASAPVAAPAVVETPAASAPGEAPPVP